MNQYSVEGFDMTENYRTLSSIDEASNYVFHKLNSLISPGE